jgi:hypothetical protein
MRIEKARQAGAAGWGWRSRKSRPFLSTMVWKQVEGLLQLCPAPISVDDAKN